MGSGHLLELMTLIMLVRAGTIEFTGASDYDY